MRAHRHPAHDLDAAGDGDVDDARADQAGGQVGGLLGRAALGVDGGGGGSSGQAGGEPRGAGDVEGLLADLADAAADDLADLGGVDARSVDQLASGRSASRSAEWMVDRPPPRRPTGSGRLRRSRLQSWQQPRRPTSADAQPRRRCGRWLRWRWSGWQSVRSGARPVLLDAASAEVAGRRAESPGHRAGLERRCVVGRLAVDRPFGGFRSAE